MLSATPSGHVCFSIQRPNLDSNQDQDLRTVLCCPLPTTGFAPASTGLQDRRLSQSSHVGIKHEREESKERPPVVEAGCSPRSTLANRCLGCSGLGCRKEAGGGVCPKLLQPKSLNC